MTDEFNVKRMLGGVAACAGVACIVVSAHFLGVSPYEDTQHAQSASSAAAIRSTRASSSSAVKKAEPDIVNINTATIAELETLKGVGPSKAQAIIDYRTKSLFYRIEDLVHVKGFGQATFDSIKDKLTVGDISPPPETASATSSAHASPAPIETKTVRNIVIMAVMTAAPNNPHDQYIELFNPNTEPVDLTGWSIKRKSSTGAESTFVSASRLKGKLVPSGKYFLLASAGYPGVADVVWPASYSLAESNNSITLYASDGNIMQSVAWKEIPVGKVYARTSPQADFAIGEYLPRTSSQ